MYRLVLSFICTHRHKPHPGGCRALALRLNARVSELTLAAECARADGESARAELERVRSRHQDDTAALEKRQRQLVSALKAVGGQTGPLQLDGGSEHMGPDHMRPDDIRPDHMGPDGVDIAMNKVERAGSPVVPSKTLLAVRERNQNQAIQEAELAAAVMQVRNTGPLPVTSMQLAFFC